MLLSIDELSESLFYPKDIYALRYAPFVRHHRHESGRELNGFLFALQGGCLFSFNGRSVRMEEGGMVYLPRGSHHEFTVDRGEALCLRIDFSLLHAQSGEEILFADAPTLLFSETPPSVMQKAEELLFLFERGYGRESLLRKQASLLALFAEIEANPASPREMAMLKPALQALTARYSEELTSEELAALCSISTTHFRRLFRRRFGMTATEYRNRLRIEEAKRLLCIGGLAVGEIAERVGFESIFYFSRVFKMQTGVSPLAFARK